MSPAPRPDSPLALRLASALGVVAALSLSVAGCRDKRRDPDEPTRASGASGAGNAASTAGPASTSSPSSTSSTSSTSTSGPGGPPTAAAQATSAATLTLDGKPVALELALVKRRPDGSLQLYAGQRGATCAMLQDNLFTGGASKVLVDSMPLRVTTASPWPDTGDTTSSSATSPGSWTLASGTMVRPSSPTRRDAAASAPATHTSSSLRLLPPALPGTVDDTR